MTFIFSADTIIVCKNINKFNMLMMTKEVYFAGDNVVITQMDHVMINVKMINQVLACVLHVQLDTHFDA